jgi:hypothetical protein
MQMKFQTQNSLNCYTVGGKQRENKQRRLIYSFYYLIYHSILNGSIQSKKFVYIFKLSAMSLRVGICEIISHTDQKNWK